jgi:hypothetical protein
MKTTISGANLSLPAPPINWATKPKRGPANIIDHSLDHVEESVTSARQLIPVFINPDHIADLYEALQRNTKLELQSDTIIDDEGNGKSILFINSRPSQQEEAYSEDLASTFSHLTMSTPSPTCQHVTRTDPVTPTSMNSAQSPLGMRTAPVAISGVSPQTSTKKKRYYVVLVGKCAGIYYDEWQVYYYFSTFSVTFCSHFLNPSRDNVEPLIRHVSNARYKGFSTHEKAKEYYLDAKQTNKVKIVRNPGDEKKYGPMDYAVE